MILIFKILHPPVHHVVCVPPPQPKRFWGGGIGGCRWDLEEVLAAVLAIKEVPEGCAHRREILQHSCVRRAPRVSGEGVQEPPEATGESALPRVCAAACLPA